MKFDFFGAQIDLDKYKKVVPERKFQIGDKITYPGHGLGEVVEMKIIEGKLYFALTLDKIQGRILLPVDKMKLMGVTHV